MKRNLWMCLVLMLFAGIGAQAVPIQMELKSAVTLPAGEIRIGDVASVASGDEALSTSVASFSLGATPLPGNVRVITRDHIVMHLGRAGFDVAQLRWHGPEACSVSVRAFKVSGEQIVRAGREYLASLPVLRRDDVRIEAEQTPRDVLVPGEPIDTSLIASAMSVDRPWGRVRVYVRVGVGERVLATVPVNFLITSRQKVLYAARPINRGDTIEKSHLEVRETVLSATAEADAYLQDVSDVVGKKAVRSLAAGTPITASLVTEPFAVRKGENVNIFLRSPYMEIITKGVAQRDGRIGDVVPIKVVISGKDITCKVFAGGSVELPL